MPHHGRIPKYRLHKASGRAVVTIDARDFYLGTYGSEESRAKYDRLPPRVYKTEKRTITTSIALRN